MLFTFTLPELGENVSSGTVARILVAVGDSVAAGQSVIEIETDKAVAEIPCPTPGTVTVLHVKEGQKISTGERILELQSATAPVTPPAPDATPETRPASRASQAGEGTDEGTLVEFRLPELGENVSSGTVARVLVAVGDSVAAGQSVIEIETDKAVAEIPCPTPGTVTALHVKEGQKISVDDPILTLASTPRSAVPQPKAPPKLQVLERPANKPPAKTAPPPSSPVAASATVRRTSTVAAPSVRRLARELGVDINEVPASDPGGRVTGDDVRRYAEAGTRPADAAVPAASPSAGIDGRKGEESREPMNTIRAKTAERMSNNWQTIPHVTQHDKADVTDIEALRKRYGAKIEAAGGKLTITSILVRVVAEALKRFPKFNASVDMDRREIVFKKYYHIGVAADTENGLLVPVVRNADAKTITQISIELPQLAAKARTRKLTLEEMQGGTFTISNLGGIGGTGFTPIINAPEVAILGVSRSSTEPVFMNGQFAPRLMMPLSLSYDHRVIDGADAARFLRWVVEVLEQPWILFLEE